MVEGGKSARAICAFILMGLGALLGQIILLRELMVVFSGNELASAIEVRADVGPEPTTNPDIIILILNIMKTSFLIFSLQSFKISYPISLCPTHVETLQWIYRVLSLPALQSFLTASWLRPTFD